jgi:hypothetical protein
MLLRAYQLRDKYTENDHANNGPSKCHAPHSRTIAVRVDVVSTIDTVQYCLEGECDSLMGRKQILRVLTKLGNQTVFIRRE